MLRDTNLPSGTVAFVFTDVEGSTKLLRSLGDRYNEVLDTHHRLLRAAWDRHGGFELVVDGDSFVVAFHRADDAVAAAIDAQRALADQAWPENRPVRIRVGVHAGFAIPHDGDYRAIAVHQCARVMSAAHGGQIFVTGETVGLLDVRPSDRQLRPLGRYRVRDFDEPVELVSVWADGMPVRNTAPRVTPADGHNIVASSTSLVGRSGDLVTLAEQIRPGRLVSLVGMGGVGKTRLATEHALACADRWPDGAWFVPLASATSDHLIANRIADAVGVSAGGADTWDVLIDHLATRRTLIVIDNCEHLAQAVAECVSGLLLRCPDVGVLATSRSPIGLVGETVLRVEPLAVDSTASAAVALFVDRAAPGIDDLDAVVELCAELDGLPLAIELAAARTSSAVSPAEILHVLRRSPRTIASTDPTLPERQRNLERLVEWSYAILGTDAREVLRRLSVFVGSFDVDVAGDVCSDDEIDEFGVVALLWQLVDSSLVRYDVTAGDTAYVMPVTVRRIVRPMLTDQEFAALQRRAAEHYRARLGPAQATGRTWVDDMARHLDNVRHVVGGLADSGAAGAIAQDLAWSVGRFHDVTDSFRQGCQELTRWLEVLPSPGPSRVGLLTMLADLHLRVSETHRAALVLAQAQDLYETVGGPSWDEAGLARSLGELSLRGGAPDDAIAIADKALATTTSMLGRARLFNLRGLSAAAIDDVAEAIWSFEQELAHAQAVGQDTFLATTHGNLAEMYLQAGTVERAAFHQLECLEMARAQRQPVLVAFSVIIAARLLARQGEHERAVTLHVAAAEALDELDISLYEADRVAIRTYLGEAEQILPSDRYTAAVAFGRHLERHVAADAATEVLESAIGVDGSISGTGGGTIFKEEA